MRTPRFLIILLLLSGLLSCEGAIDIHGHVYDNTTKRRIDSVQVILVLGENDTIWKCKPSVSVHNQNELDRDKYQLAFTDTGGYFSISSGLIGIGPREVKTKIIFTKRGYAPAIVATGERSNFDSVQMRQLQ